MQSKSACCLGAGARQITLEGVYHSPLGSIAAVEGGKEGPDKSSPGRPWYGSPDVVDRWIDAVVADESELQDAKVELGQLVGSIVPDEK